MRYESNDERIERLENQVAKLEKIVIGILEVLQKGRAGNMRLTSLIILLKNDQVAIMRFLLSDSFIKDDNVRKQFLSQVARLESDCEKMEAMVADWGKAIQNPEPEAPPPDKPSPPGPA